MHLKIDILLFYSIEKFNAKIFYQLLRKIYQFIIFCHFSILRCFTFSYYAFVIFKINKYEKDYGTQDHKKIS